MMVPQKDTPMEMQSLTRMMANKAKQAFIREIKRPAHDQPDPIRFKKPGAAYSAGAVDYLCVGERGVKFTLPATWA